MEIIAIITVMGMIAVGFLLRAGFHTLRRFQNNASVVLDLIDEMQEEQPIRQIQNLTNTYEGIIRRDFPEFDAKEFLQTAESVLLNILNTLEEGCLHSEEYLTKGLKDTLLEQIRDLESRREKIRYDEILIHKSAIARYTKTTGSCVIMVEIALEYAYSRSQVQSTVETRKKAQYKYIVEAVYVQDIAKMSDQSMIGHNCPNCGAPVVELGENKFCRYCGSGLTEINMRIWRFNSYKKA